MTLITQTVEESTVKSATNITLNEKVFYGEYLGQYDRETGAKRCMKKNMSLPLPRNKPDQIKLLKILRQLAPKSTSNKNIYIDLKEIDIQGKSFSQYFNS